MSKEVGKTEGLRAFRKLKELNTLIDNLNESLLELHERLQPFSMANTVTDVSIFPLEEIPEVKFLVELDSTSLRVIDLIQRVETINKTLGI